MSAPAIPMLLRARERARTHTHTHTHTRTHTHANTRARARTRVHARARARRGAGRERAQAHGMAWPLLFCLPPVEEIGRESLERIPARARQCGARTHSARRTRCNGQRTPSTRARTRPCRGGAEPSEAAAAWSARGYSRALNERCRAERAAEPKCTGKAFRAFVGHSVAEGTEPDKDRAR